MPYAAEISRANPTCFLFLVDQSGSMAKPFGGQAGKSKAQGVADAINRLLQNLAIKCAKSEGIRDYFHVGVIGYGKQVAPAFGGTLASRRLVPIRELADHPLRVEERIRTLDDGAGGLLQQRLKFPVWLEPTAAGKTPMCQALNLAREILQEFIGAFPGCYPPLVLNISDGAATDGSPEPVAGALRAMASRDGNVLLFNAHLSSQVMQAIEFPDSEENLTEAYSRLLFRISSPLPEKIRAAARSEGMSATETARGFVFNADLVAVIRFLDLGTRVAQNLR
ncbi:MAG: VWA domain-containing protein [Gemmataceae bacterium]|nr:VWA domain-containing protein [Gemmataceae bacterium]